jgi:hypothetical protein
VSPVHFVTGINLGGVTATQEVIFTNTTAYRYYELYQTAGVSTDIPYTEEIEFRISA